MKTLLGSYSPTVWCVNKERVQCQTTPTSWDKFQFGHPPSRPWLGSSDRGPEDVVVYYSSRTIPTQHEQTDTNPSVEMVVHTSVYHLDVSPEGLPTHRPRTPQERGVIPLHDKQEFERLGPHVQFREPPNSLWF